MGNVRNLPSIDALLREAEHLQAAYGRERTVEALRRAVDEARQAALGGAAVASAAALIARAAGQLADATRPTLRPVINATGVIIHTNLGRAPLSDAALAAMRAAAQGYSTLEYDLEPGVRGHRDHHAERLLTDLTGAEAALVVNNNAAGVLLALTALVQGREVIISRGELIEIGGAFRIPDVMAQSGAVMVEVGTTNRTRLHDYEAAITDATGAIVRAHPSNFRIVGFSEAVPLADLAALAHAHGLVLIHDAGSGALLDPSAYGLAREPLIAESLAAGADVVLFSGDKLLGGPQAGIAVGRADLIARMKRHPLARAVRADKLCLAGLVATLEHYWRGEAVEQIPVWRMISLPLDAIRARAETWAAAAPGEVVAAESTVGGGSLPGETLPTWAFAPHVDQPNAAAARLRQHEPPVIARVAQDRLLLDPRTVFPEQDAQVIAALRTLTG